MNHVLHSVFAGLACAGPSLAWAAQEPEWSMEVLVGDALNLSTRTHIQHAATSTAAFDGDYETRGFEGPLHYTIRLTHWDQDRGWALELLHHKLNLRNRPQGVEALSISHGFNIVTISRAYALGSWRLRVGAGPVVAHPEARIGGSSYDGDYELAGAAIVGSVGAAVPLTTQLLITGEVAATYGYAKVHPSGEPDLTFDVRNPAFHARVGLGYRF
jgi:hypothetical protein